MARILDDRGVQSTAFMEMELGNVTTNTELLV